MKFKILTFNLLGIPLISQNFDSRMYKIPQEIGKLSPDIVCLQEVWLSSLRRKLEILMRNQGYPFSAFDEKGQRVQGGLVTFSKFPIQDLSFVRFKNQSSSRLHRIADKAFYKGFLDSRISLDQKKISVINLHLSANYKDEFLRQDLYFRQVDGQVKLLTYYIEKMDRGIPLILAGDFNVAPHSLFYNKIIHRLNLIDSMGNSQDPSELPHSLIRVHRLSQRKISRRADYIFIKRYPKALVQGEIVLNQPCQLSNNQNTYLSDHFGILANISDD